MLKLQLEIAAEQKQGGSANGSVQAQEKCEKKEVTIGPKEPGVGNTQSTYLDWEDSSGAGVETSATSSKPVGEKTEESPFKKPRLRKKPSSQDEQDPWSSPEMGKPIVFPSQSGKFGAEPTHVFNLANQAEVESGRKESSDHHEQEDDLRTGGPRYHQCVT